MEVPVIEFLAISGLLDYFFICFIISQLVILYSQVENSSTAQVGGPQDAVGDAVPVLEGSDIPLPEDGFAHEVNFFCYLILRGRIFNAFSFQALKLMLVPVLAHSFMILF